MSGDPARRLSRLIGRRTFIKQSSGLFVAATALSCGGGDGPNGPGGQPADLAFASDWSTARGTAANAVSDGGKWALNIDNGATVAPDRMEIIAASGLGFPGGMSNILKVRHPEALTSSYYWNVSVINGWPLPPSGESLYKRMYFRHDIGGTGGGDMHSVSTGPPGACPYSWGFQFARAGTSQFEFSISTTVAGNEHRWTFNQLLNRETTYRIECAFLRQDVNLWRMHARLYGPNEALLGDDAAFNCTWHGTHTLQSYTGSITSVTDCHRNLMIGQQNQPGRGSTDPAHENMYYGGVAISLSDWCGPYVAGEGP